MVSGNKIEFAVAVEVGDGHKIGTNSRVKGLLALEGAVAVAQQDADGVIAIISGNEIEFAVAVEVGDGYATGTTARGEVSFGLEGAVAVA